MKNANALQTIEENLTFEQLKERANLLIKSGFLPPSIKTAEQAITIILTGRDLRLGMMESLRSINVIQGRPALSAGLMLALCQRTGELEDMLVEEKPGFCVTTITRTGRSPYAYSFSMDDAKALGLSEKDNWRKQPKTMLRWRSLSGNLRVTFADAICGIYTDDEAEDIIADKVQVHAAIEEQAQVIKETLEPVDPESIHAAGEELEFVNGIGASFIQDKNFYFKYADRTISEIYQDKTPAGDPKGKKFLTMVSEKSSSPADRANLSKYLELMEREDA